MTRLSASFVLGYHGCDGKVGKAALGGRLDLIGSDKDYDWLGPGTYFWEGDPQRALEWAEQKVARGDYETPYVLGAVIDLGNCLDLLVRENLDLLRLAYDSLAESHRKSGLSLLSNRDMKTDGSKDKLLRYLDCAVIRRLHAIIENPAREFASNGNRPPKFDTVRGLFTEGEAVYEGGGFNLKTHTQVAVRTSECIKGLFLPRPPVLTRRPRTRPAA